MLGNDILDTERRGTPLSSEDERHIGFLISDVARLMRTAFDRRVRRLGLTRSQWLVINRLHRRPGATQSELAEMLEVEKATAGRMVDRMEKKGWVVRRPGRHRPAGQPAAPDRRGRPAAGAVGADRRPHRRRRAGACCRPREREQFSEWMRRVKRQLQTMLEPEFAGVAGCGSSRSWSE